MKMTFRWYGEDDSVTLQKIRQIPCISDITTAVYKPVGEVWTDDELTNIPVYSGAKAAISNFTKWLSVHFSKKDGIPLPSFLIPKTLLIQKEQSLLRPFFL